MTMRPMALIFAVDEHGGFGKNGKLPWSYPEDLKHFKEVTDGHPCIMGRRTYEDMLQMRKDRDKNKKSATIKNILPGREAFVITRDPKFTAPGATVVRSMREGVQSLDRTDRRTVFAIGGYRVFIEALTWAETIHMTIIKGDHKCDRFFPVRVLNKGYRIVDGEETDNLSFVTYKRVR